MSTIQVTKIGIGYQSPGQRPSCRNCKHGEEVRADRMPPFDTAYWRCKRFGFRTTAMATCQQQQPKSSSNQESAHEVL